MDAYLNTAYVPKVYSVSNTSVQSVGNRSGSSELDDESFFTVDKFGILKYQI